MLYSFTLLNWMNYRILNRIIAIEKRWNMRPFSFVIGILLTIALLVPVQAQGDGLVAEWHFDEDARIRTKIMERL